MTKTIPDTRKTAKIAAVSADVTEASGGRVEGSNAVPALAAASLAAMYAVACFAAVANDASRVTIWL